MLIQNFYTIISQHTKQKFHNCKIAKISEHDYI